MKTLPYMYHRCDTQRIEQYAKECLLYPQPYYAYSCIQRHTTVFRRMLGMFDAEPYAVAGLARELVHEVKTRLQGARVFSVEVVINEDNASLNTVLSIRVIHEEIPKIVLVGVDTRPKPQTLQRPHTKTVTQKPARVLTD